MMFTAVWDKSSTTSCTALKITGLLNPLINYINLFCVHFAILPEINRSLTEFVHSWNHHRLSTAQNLTPEQFYVIGMIERID